LTAAGCISETNEFQNDDKNTNALSFYRFQNGLSKFFEPVQKFDCIYCLFKNFCVSTKTKFAEWKSSFGVAQNV
jgi:hypothetical protein